ncbi:MAG: SPFH domain-containing protein [Planctomycetota bacterium]|nr:SPFH domain-containing protein [Planctomycetota bacterium]
MRSFFQALGELLASVVRAIQRVSGAIVRGIGSGMRGLARWSWRGTVAAARSRTLRATASVVLALVRTAAWTAVFAALALGIGWFGFQRVPAGFVGVRQDNFGAGIRPVDYAAGIYFAPRGLVTWHDVEKKTHVLDFAWESEGGDWPPIEVRTKDGNICHLGVSLLYRVKPGEAHALVKDGLRTAYHQRVKGTTEKIVLEEFGKLTSTEYADTDVRLARCAATLARLKEPLAEYHVEAESLLVTQFLFAMQYEQKLQEKQLLAQQELMTAAQRELETNREVIAVEEARIDAAEKAIRAERDSVIQTRFAAGRKQIVALEQEAKEYDRRRKVEGQAEYDRLVAEGDRALLQAQGLQEILANELYDSDGGRILLARKAAENLNLKVVTLNANDPRVPNVLDLDQMVRLLLGAAPLTTP